MQMGIEMAASFGEILEIGALAKSDHQVVDDGERLCLSWLGHPGCVLIKGDISAVM